MAAYRYLTFDLLTNTFLAELPFFGVSYGSLLNGAGTFTGTLKLGQLSAGVITETLAQIRTYGALFAGPYGSMLAAPDPVTVPVGNVGDVWVAATQPARTALYVVRDGAIVWGGVIWTFRYDSNGRTAQVAGNEFLSYFDHREIRSTLTYTGVDQVTIAKGLVDVAQAANLPWSTIRVATPTPTATGVVRTITYNAYEAKNVGQSLRDLTAMDQGCDFGFDLSWSASVPSITFNVAGTRGRSAAATGFSFDWGRNIVSYTHAIDGTRAVNSQQVLGAGSGDLMVRSTVNRTDALSAGYPLLDGSASWKDLADVASTTAKAAGLAAVAGFPVAIPDVVVRGDLDPVAGSYVCGDQATVNIVDERFPAGLSTVLRIAAWNVTPGDAGQETVQLTFATA